MAYIEFFPVVFERIVYLYGLGTFLITSVAAEHVYFVFEYQSETGGAGSKHGSHVSPFF